MGKSIKDLAPDDLRRIVSALDERFNLIDLILANTDPRISSLPYPAGKPIASLTFAQAARIVHALEKHHNLFAFIETRALTPPASPTDARPATTVPISRRTIAPGAPASAARKP